MDKTQKHRILCEKINKMYHYKNEEYGDSFSASIQKYGYIAALTRISDKFHEFEHLILSKDNGPDTNEVIIDTCLNAANYFLMTIIELESDEWKIAKDTVKPTELDWKYTDDHCTSDDYYLKSDIKKKVSIEQDYPYPNLREIEDREHYNHKKRQILCEGE